MPSYKAPLDDIRFILNEVIDAGSLAQLPGYTEATAEANDTILEAAAQVCQEVLFPLNQSGDAEGCVWENGNVKTPKGFKEAYQTFCQSGWPGLSCKTEFGGQGLPLLLNFVIDEMVCSANMSFGMYPGLSHGAYNAIDKHGTDELKKRYLPKMVEGVWTGTMCLTEPQCGTDLGLVRTKAVPDGAVAVATGAGAPGAEQSRQYKITGSKIFISAGEHDLSENIIHLVLARLPDAPA